MAFPYRTVVVWSEADAVYVARVPALPGVAAHGDTEADARAEAHRAGEAVLAAMAAHGREPPPFD